MENIDPKKLSGMESFFSKVEIMVAPGDGMWNPKQPEHYFYVGASALAQIIRSLAASRRSEGSIRRVLDYACGYGRVLRWLKAGFPNARVIGIDVDEKAVVAAASVVGVETRHLDISLSKPIGAPFDLIWVGSLFTHLPQPEMKRVLYYISEHLTEGGVLVFTTHGSLVVERFRKQERLYNLTPDSAYEIVTQYERLGYGYADYPEALGYGISVSRPSIVAQLLDECGFSLAYFEAQGWAGHQDVYGCYSRTT